MATHGNPALADPRPDSPAEPTVLRLKRDRHAPGRTPVLPERHLWYPRCKLAAEIALACVLAVPVLPVVLLAALLVKLTSKGPAFYTQTRVGKDGKLFTILKLRTMFDNCEAVSGPRWSLPGDPRVTPVGWLLRATHLDELPQLLNVLRGEMSLVGPRPERPEFVPQLEKALPAYRQRLNVRPGVTGLAQVLLPPDSDIESVRRKLSHDLWYVRRLSPWLDLRLLVCTGLYALAIPFRLTARLVALPRSADVEKAMRDLVPDAPAPRARLSA
jgi:lipopolysaccharide/colanic/teichoic acid biosynthesis glycosyltransferase